MCACFVYECVSTGRWRGKGGVDQVARTAIGLDLRHERVL